ncbi:type VII toxin-antitoxin system MntA family adenylyltransferase antitoxin [Nitratifractor sp.]
MRDDRLKALLQRENRIQFALLFGSFADDSAHGMSDIDIAVSLRSPMELLEMGALIAQLESLTRRRVDLLVVNDLPEERPKLAFSIVQSHRILLIRDEEAYIDFKERTYRNYFDQEAMFRQFDESFVRKVLDAS